MFDLIIKENEKKWLRTNYPTLKIKKDRSGCAKITGMLRFDMVFSPEEESYVIKPSPEHLTRGQRIQDEYQIEIIFKNSEHSNLPQVYEKSGRIVVAANNRKRDLRDLHINPDLGNAACLCLNTEEGDWFPNGFNIQDFFHNLVIPFFYGQAYFEKNGIWPYKEYSHGIYGLLEGYSKTGSITKEKVREFLDYLRKRKDWPFLQVRLDPKKEVKGHHFCMCGSSKYFRNCHKEAFRGLWKLKQDAINFRIEI